MYAKLTEVKPGDILTADAGFTCMSAGPHTVEVDDRGQLYIPCNDGKHFLDGQLNIDDEYVGLTRSPDQALTGTATSLRHPMNAGRLGTSHARALLAIAAPFQLLSGSGWLFAATVAFVTHAASRAPASRFGMVTQDDANDPAAMARFLRSLARHCNAAAESIDPQPAPKIAPETAIAHEETQ